MSTAETPATPRAEQRPAKQRELSDKQRAAARAAELLDSGTLDTDTSDKFYFDHTAVPDGWTYEWKRRTVLNQEDPAYQVELRRMGWEPVPAIRHPEMMPMGYKGDTIERDGMMLMERPAIITKKVQARDLKNARDQVRMGENRLQEADTGHFERKGPAGSLVSVKHSMEPLEIPDE